MTDRPIIFSTPMIRALLAGRKTQTRRLASSPLAKVNPGDKLWVRERGNWTQPMPCQITGRSISFRAYSATCEDSAFSFFGGKRRPSIHMPRWASRLTLVVESVKTEWLEDISQEDAVAEGIAWSEGWAGWTADPGPNGGQYFHGSDPRISFWKLWNGLHGEEIEGVRVVALTFRVVPQNIDALDPAPSARAAAGVG